jgi:hypothetical protein
VKRHRSARILAAGHAFVQNLRRSHYDITTDAPSRHRLRIAFDDLAIIHGQLRAATARAGTETSR